MVAQFKLVASAVGLAVLLSACGGGGGGGGDDAAPASGSTAGAPAPAVPATTTVSIGFGLKQLQLAWTPVTGATSYRVLEAADGATFTQIDEVPGSQTSYNREIAVHLQNWSAARYQVQACNTEGCSTSAAADAASGVLQSIGYFKAANTNAGDRFAWILALSSDGQTLAVGAPGEASAGTDPADNTAANAGAVYVFTRAASGWSQQAYLKAATPQAAATFGHSLALSADGTTLVAGAPLENVSSLNDAGAAYVFVRSGATWAPQATLKAASPAANAYFGWASALSNDGNTLAISAVGTASDAGAVYVFTRSGANWAQRSVLSGANTTAADGFGTALAINGAGTVLAVGAPFRLSEAGAAYIFSGSGASWTETAYLKASNTQAGDNFGAAVALSSAGNVLAVGAPYESSSATGINGAEGDNSATKAGAVYLFGKSDTTWTQRVYVKASNTGANDNFGSALALGGNGDWLVVGAMGESSAATGIGGNQADNSRDGVGAAYTFAFANDSWAQQAYLKPATALAGGEFGSTFGVSADLRTLAIGASFEGSGATGVSGNQASTAAPEAGAAWLY